jgi:predicted MFS family arabinose efflux permease
MLTSSAIYEVGCFAGALFSFVYGEVLSRRTCIIVAVFVMCIGATLQTVSVNMSQLIAGRIVTGLVSHLLPRSS